MNRCAIMDGDANGQGTLIDWRSEGASARRAQDTSGGASMHANSEQNGMQVAAWVGYGVL